MDGDPGEKNRRNLNLAIGRIVRLSESSYGGVQGERSGPVAPGVDGLIRALAQELLALPDQLAPLLLLGQMGQRLLHGAELAHLALMQGLLAAALIQLPAFQPLALGGSERRVEPLGELALAHGQLLLVLLALQQGALHFARGRLGEGRGHERGDEERPQAVPGQGDHDEGPGQRSAGGTAPAAGVSPAGSARVGGGIFGASGGIGDSRCS